VSTCLPAGRAARTRWAIGFKEAALCEWTKAHREQYERFLIETLSFPNLVPATPSAREANLSPEEAVARTGASLSTLPTEVNDIRLKWLCL